MRSLFEYAALLALPSLINAVALSDMTPRATGLPDDCNDVYTSSIPECAPKDFTSGDCSAQCVEALNGLVPSLRKACGSKGIKGQNLVVAFLAGVGPQQLCKNAKSGDAVSTTANKPSTKSPTASKTKIVSSTTTAHSAKQTSSLIIDSSSMPASSSSSSSSSETHSAPKTTSSSAAVSSEAASSTASGKTTHSASQTTTSSQATSSPGNEETNFDDNSGGGSPFDTEGNLRNSASGLSSVSTFSVILPAAAAALLARFY